MMRQGLLILLMMIYGADILVAQKVLEVQIPMFDGFLGTKMLKNGVNDLEERWTRGYGYAEVGFIEMDKWMVSTRVYQNDFRVRSNSYSHDEIHFGGKEGVVNITRFNRNQRAMILGIRGGYPIQTDDGFFSISAGLDFSFFGERAQLDFLRKVELSGSHFRGDNYYKMIYKGSIHQTYKRTSAVIEFAHRTKMSSTMYMKFYGTLQWYPGVEGVYTEEAVDYISNIKKVSRTQKSNPLFIGVGIKFTSLWGVKGHWDD